MGWAVGPPAEGRNGLRKFPILKWREFDTHADRLGVGVHHVVLGRMCT